MNAKDVFRNSSEMNLFILKSYISDLSDEELMMRPSPTSNHLAWQLGHLISSEAKIIAEVSPAHAIELPEGFTEAYDKAQTGVDDPTKFHSKQEYLDQFERVRAASLSALDSFSDEDFDKPSPPRYGDFFPTIGSVMLLVCSHPLMHAGQIAVVRRQLGKPILI